MNKPARSAFLAAQSALKQAESLLHDAVVSVDSFTLVDIARRGHALKAAWSTWCTAYCAMMEEPRTEGPLTNVHRDYKTAWVGQMEASPMAGPAFESVVRTPGTHDLFHRVPTARVLAAMNACL
jgi:Tfp pilus assembly protein PilX